MSAAPTPRARLARDGNLGRADRFIRVVIGVALVGTGLFAMRGAWRFVLAAVGAVLAFSGTVGFCHVYKVLGVCTRGTRPPS